MPLPMTARSQARLILSIASDAGGSMLSVDEFATFAANAGARVLPRSATCPGGHQGAQVASLAL